MNVTLRLLQRNVAYISYKCCLIKNNRGKLHFSNTISPIFYTFPTLQEVILALFQLFGEDFVGETVGRKRLWLT